MASISDNFLQWSINLHGKFDRENAKLFVEVIDAVIESETKISNKIEYLFKSLDADVHRNISLRNSIQKKLTDKEIYQVQAKEPQ